MKGTCHSNMDYMTCMFSTHKAGFDYNHSNLFNNIHVSFLWILFCFLKADNI